MKKGISLVALVITIVVMIILTGAVIMSVGKNGLIARAQETVRKSDLATAQEKVMVEVAKIKVDAELVNQNVGEYMTSNSANLTTSLSAKGIGFTVNPENIYFTVDGKYRVITDLDGKIILDANGNGVIELATYTITSTLTGVTGTVPANVESTSLPLEITFTAQSGYLLPEAAGVTVTGGTFTWDKATGKLTITGVTDNMAITIVADQPAITNKLNGTSIDDQCKLFNDDWDYEPVDLDIYTYTFRSGKTVTSINATVTIDGSTTTKTTGANFITMTSSTTNTEKVIIYNNGKMHVNLDHTQQTNWNPEDGRKIEVEVTYTFIDSTTDTDNFIYYSWCPCLVQGTMVDVVVEEEDEDGKKKKTRKKKRIEDLTYEDELIVWDFDKGEFTTTKVLWLMERKSTEAYNLLKFSDGSELKTVNQHRIFNKEAGKFTYPMTDDTPIGTTTYNAEGKEVQLVSKEVIKEHVNYYNAISNYHMNIFANGVLTSCRLNNLYPIEDMKFVKDDRELAKREDFASIPDEYFYGLRLAEQPKEINKGNDVVFDSSLEEYVKRIMNDAK